MPIICLLAMCFKSLITERIWYRFLTDFFSMLILTALLFLYNSMFGRTFHIAFIIIINSPAMNEHPHTHISD